jgi:hypothetical protein
MRSGFDTQALAQAVSKPGIDPRSWISLAIIEDLGVDPSSGVYADIRLMPAGDKETCVIGSDYIGDGYGAWFPLAAGDLVVVGFPRGDSASGPILLKRLWSGADKPPPELGSSNGADPPTNPTIVIGAGQTARIVCRPGATVEIVGETTAQPVAVAPPNDDNWSRLADTFNQWASVATPPSLGDIAALKAALLALLAPVPPPGATWPAPTAASRLKAE